MGGNLQNIPGGGSAAPGTPQPGDLTAGRVPDLPAAEVETDKRTRSSESTIPAAADGPDDRSRNRSLLKKILVPVVLAVIGLALLLGAFLLYPTQGQLPTPPFATLYLNVTFPTPDIIYTVNQVSSSTAKITIEVELPSGTLRPPAGARADLLIAPPFGTDFSTCPSSFCHSSTGSTEYIQIWALPLSFKTVKGQYGSFGAAFVDVFVKAQSFGETSNGVTAAAAIPQIFCNDCVDTVLEAQYNIPSASNYDWSSFPTQFANGTYARWNEQVNADGVTDGKAAVGVDHANQANDDNKTFIAGALLGLAGGALLSAVQEALHVND